MSSAHYLHFICCFSAIPPAPVQPRKGLTWAIQSSGLATRKSSGSILWKDSEIMVWDSNIVSCPWIDKRNESWGMNDWRERNVPACSWQGFRGAGLSTFASISARRCHACICLIRFVVTIFFLHLYAHRYFWSYYNMGFQSYISWKLSEFTAEEGFSADLRSALVLSVRWGIYLGEGSVYPF